MQAEAILGDVTWVVMEWDCGKIGGFERVTVGTYGGENGGHNVQMSTASPLSLAAARNCVICAGLCHVFAHS